MVVPIFQNQACLVINKLPGESAEFPQIEAEGDIFPVHRLDMPVSGCLLFARTPEAAAFLSKAFANQAVKKRYWAIVEKPKTEIPREAELVHWLRKDKNGNKSFAANEQSRQSKKAVLRYRLIGEGDNYLFLEIDLVTGRHHQIRAQFAATGLHVKGDLKYGARRSEKAGGIRLHAHSLDFPNPLKPDEIISVAAKPPVMDPLWEAFASVHLHFFQKI
jgi:23S rRNA pseudouridine1911/1915/1917 synthase